MILYLSVNTMHYFFVLPIAGSCLWCRSFLLWFYFSVRPSSWWQPSCCCVAWGDLVCVLASLLYFITKYCNCVMSVLCNCNGTHDVLICGRRAFPQFKISSPFILLYRVYFDCSLKYAHHIFELCMDKNHGRI